MYSFILFKNDQMLKTSTRDYEKLSMVTCRMQSIEKISVWAVFILKDFIETHRFTFAVSSEWMFPLSFLFSYTTDHALP